MVAIAEVEIEAKNGGWGGWNGGEDQRKRRI